MCICLVFGALLILAAFQLMLFFFRSFAMISLTVSTVVFAILIFRLLSKLLEVKDFTDDPDFKDGWFGRGTKTEGEDTTIHPFTINVKDDVLSDLKRRLENTRLAEPLEDVQFTYGFNPDYLRQLIKYWKEEYDWRKQEAELNKYPHFITKIEGIDVHFMHAIPDLEKRKVRTIPLMIIHGWPGCFAEFYKIIPLLTTPSPDRDFVFEVICPSIPGYGFSEAAHKKGLTSRATGRILMKLMERIGHQQFYVQGGDWGSNIATNMARYYPSRILGLHLNMFAFGLTWLGMLKLLLITMFPMMISKEEHKLIFPLRRTFKLFCQETGYFHIQATKPDTLGCALSDTPAGLAAYLLEKFSSATNMSYVKREDGGLTEKFTKDELITNCMVYWVTNSFPSAARFYKETMRDFMKHEKYSVIVPAGVAIFPNEVLVYPRMMLSSQLKNIISYTLMPRGGHFAAMEEPRLLSEDIWKFVRIVEKERDF